MTRSEHIHIAPHQNPSRVYITEYIDQESNSCLGARSGCCNKSIYWMGEGPICSECTEVIPVTRHRLILDESSVIGIDSKTSHSRLRVWVNYWTGLGEENIDIT